MRQVGKTKLVAPHVRRTAGMVRAMRSIGGQRQQGADKSAASVVGRGARYGSRLLGRQAHTVGAGVDNVVQAVSNEDAGQAMGQVSWQAGRAAARYGLRRSGLVRRAGRVVRAPVKAAGRQSGRGAYRLARAVVRAVVRVAGRIIAAPVVALSTPWLIAGVVGMIAVMSIAALIPTWITSMVDTGQSEQVGVVMVDDYPWKDDVRGPDGSPRDLYNTPNPYTGYYYGNCTDFVYWRVNRDMGGQVGGWVYTRTQLTPLGGNGRQWGQGGNLPGWQTISRADQAQPGDIVSFEAMTLGHNSPFGHVAYVVGVGDGKLVTENYGIAQYYVEHIDLGDVQTQIEAGTVVIKRNPELPEGGPLGAGSSSEVVQWAVGQQGLPYGRGQGNGSIDCCWLVYRAYENGRGIRLPMSVPGNPWATSKCEYAMYSLASTYGGRLVPFEDRQPGDIVFMQDKAIDSSIDTITHVAISLGPGQLIDAIPQGGVGIRRESDYAYTQTILPHVVRVEG